MSGHCHYCGRYITYQGSATVCRLHRDLVTLDPQAPARLVSTAVTVGCSTSKAPSGDR